MVETIHLPQLMRAPDQTETVSVQEWFEGFDSLTPVEGQVKATHNGNFLQVEGNATTIVTLTCDRCLQRYNHRLSCEASELIWIQDQAEADAQSVGKEYLEVADLVETLLPSGYFQPDEWLYQQLCLALPQRQICSQDCSGIQVDAVLDSEPADYRWAKLADLHQQIRNESN